MLQVNITLEHLQRSMRIGTSDSGADWAYIFKSLQYNTTLDYLNLSRMGLVATEDTAHALTTILQFNKTLTHLDLSANGNS